MEANFEIAREYNNDIMLVNTDGGDITPHFHRHIEIYYVLSGESEIRINRETKILTKNQMAIAGCYDVHYYRRLKSGRAYILLIPPKFLGEYLKYIQDKKLLSNFITDENKAREILAYIKKLEKNAIDNPLYLSGLFNTILGCAADSCGVIESKRAADFNFIKDVMSYIEENFTHEITLEGLAEKFNYSKFHFSKLFNSYFTCNLNEALNILRARNAANLIDGGQSLTDAVWNSGFTSMRTFYRIFKKVYGMTYSEYLRNKP